MDRAGHTRETDLRMKIYVALLRGINLGSHNKVAMPALRALVEGLGGCTDVTTYIQSGNVVLRSDKTAAALQTALEKAIAKEFGIDVAVFVRTTPQLQKIVDANPFLKKRNDPSTLHVVFLSAKPKADGVKRITTDDWGGDEIEVVGEQAYLHCPNGYGRSKLGNAFVEKQLGVAGTTRNWRTTAKLLELAGG
jgi:uncharacterized protein (DUF1697 family)